MKLGFPDGLVVKYPPADVGNMSSVPGLGRSPGEGIWKAQSMGSQKELDMNYQINNSNNPVKLLIHFLFFLTS